MKAEGHEEGQLQTARRVAELMMLYLTHGPAIGVREAAKLMEIHPSISQRLFSTLAATGMVIKDQSTGKYRLGAWVADLGAVAAGSYSMRSLAEPYMVKVRDVTKETVTLHERWGDNRRISHVVEGLYEIRQIPKVGTYRSLLIGSSGKAILAFLENRDAETIINGVQWPLKTPTDKVMSMDEFLDNLRTVRRNGFDVTEGESALGAAGMSAPIIGARGYAVASLTVSGPAFRCTTDFFQEHVHVLKEAASKISIMIGGKAN
ncbi:IclR family transcriptional regulator [Paradesulfitobacterium ferrireducens]|uniref:IclR family transcriptional regulator n=1 Tax=Paradesulfitobacterium ferrireducens TaxID=2816476 RepID=UPI001A8FD606|nr:IclR family transcriptional regulator [Paradesulfitobacterium ferrireducens]